MEFATASSPEIPLAEEEDLVEPHALRQLLDAPVRVVEARLEVDDGLAEGAEPEVPRLDDSRVDWAHRDLGDALPFHLEELVAAVRDAFATFVRSSNSFLRGKTCVGPVLVKRQRPRVGIALWDQAEHVLDLALVQSGRRQTERHAGEGGRRLGVTLLDPCDDDDEDVLSAAMPNAYRRTKPPLTRRSSEQTIVASFPFELVVDVERKAPGCLPCC